MSNASNGGVCRAPHADGLVHDAQGRWWEMLYAGQVFSRIKQPPRAAKAKKSKCHGNRKLYHFKRKWRARGLDEQAIQALLQARQQQQQQQGVNGSHSDDQMVPQGAVVEKRKRPQSMATSVQSFSQLSISPRSTKKRKGTTQDSSSSMEDALSEVGEMRVRLDKYSRYLKMPTKLLLRSLRLQLDHRLKRDFERHYILRRLHLLDEHYCVDRIRHLYQSYWDLGSQDRRWPVSWRESFVFHKE